MSFGFFRAWGLGLRFYGLGCRRIGGFRVLGFRVCSSLSSRLTGKRQGIQALSFKTPCPASNFSGCKAGCDGPKILPVVGDLHRPFHTGFRVWGFGGLEFSGLRGLGV